MSSHFDKVVKITPTQLETLNSGGSVSGHTSDPSSMYLEGLESWSEYVSISYNGTNITLKDKCFYQFQATSDADNSTIEDFGIVFLETSNSQNYLVAGVRMNNGSTFYRLTLYHITSNLWAVYVYINNSSAISSLTPTGGLKVRYKKLNL